MSSKIAVRSATRRWSGAGVPPIVDTHSSSYRWRALGLANAARRVIAVVKLWRQRARGRAALAALDDHMLNDIGLSRADVTREINKPFWTG